MGGISGTHDSEEISKNILPEYLQHKTSLRESTSRRDDSINMDLK
jgi:hypothetical protein